MIVCSEMVLVIEFIVIEYVVVVIVGCMDVKLGVVNVIFGEVVFLFDICSEYDDMCDKVLDVILFKFCDIVNCCWVDFNWQMMYQVNVVYCNFVLFQILVQVIELIGIKLLSFLLGVGYDVMVMDVICLVSMLFVRCKGGISYYFGELVIYVDV